MAQGQTDLDQSDDIQAILARSRTLTGQAHRLSRSINEVVEEMHEFVEDIRRFPDRRQRNQPYEGEDRRVRR